MWSSKPGSFMAAADQLHVRVVGAGTHGSTPYRGKDPIPVACEMVTALQTMITRQFDVFDPVVLTVGRIAGGTKENIIPDDAFFDATVRTFSDETRTKVQQTSTQLVEAMAAAHGLIAEVDYQIGYPVTVNNAAEYELRAGRRSSTSSAPTGSANAANPRCGAEDMSYVLNEVPGVYLNLSACRSADPDAAADNHSPLADFDDSILPDAAALLAELAVRRLARGPRIGRNPDSLTVEAPRDYGHVSSREGLRRRSRWLPLLRAAGTRS